MPSPTLLEILGAAGLGGAVVAGLFFRQIDTLRKRIKEREDSIGRTSKLLIEKNIELFDQNIQQQKLLASKDDFIAIASHQLRTPAAEIKWALGTILQQPPEEAPRRADIENTFKSAKKMERLIEDLLQFVTVEQGRASLAVTPYDPDAVVLATAQRLAKDFSKRSIKLTTSTNFGGTISSIGQNALDMVVGNLLENAYLYTSDPGEITVRTSRGEGGRFEFEVEDTGIGVSNDMRERLFVKFRRGSEAQEMNTEGSGLGLYIVRTILDRIGGIAQFKPREGGGSIFSFSVSAKGATAVPAPLSPPHKS